MFGKFLFSVAAIATTIATTQAGDVYNTNTNQLTIPSVQLGNTIYTNVVITLNNFTVNSVGGSQPLGNVSATCSISNFSTSIYNAIQSGMTLAQVNQIIGCQPDASATLRSTAFVLYTWIVITQGGHESIQVYFDPTGTVATPIGNTLKMSSGF
jgi:hypothetical protein